ncbi:MAG: PVC-type heme-binding CxxCH protein [Pirellulaceae bacterium]
MLSPNRCKNLLVALVLLVLAVGHTASKLHAADRQEGPGAREPSTLAEEFGAPVRSTPPRTAMEELAGLHVPPGFVVELVASEPQIAKPMNLAFDLRGRLWVTQTVEYPYPAKEGEPSRDAVVILEDRDGDGLRETVTRFVEGLNIPIGVLPYGDGCISISIPDLLWLRDTDGDGLCDRREKILGPFDTTRDTHGMVNSLRLGPDGWIYANHGFNNQSKVQGLDGHSIQMNSGNVFRFRPNGSRVELFTQGQVNPFGMAVDEFGFLFTADCHSKPITQLIRGGCYPSFGRPDDGLGFVPSTMEHLHGSTAIAGLAIGSEGGWPDAYRDQFFSGNVMTSRINRNRIVRQGATVRAEELPDLLTSEDPWFRPVDLRFGPDGALYIADFYNRIIGHYEVPLDHPDRDRERGRIFRIRMANPATSQPNLFAASLKEKVKLLSDSSATVRRMARESLAVSQDADCDAELAKLLADREAASVAMVEAMWCWRQRHGKLPESWSTLLNHDLPLVAVHAVKMADSLPAFHRWDELLARWQVAAVDGDQAVVERAIVEAIGHAGPFSALEPLIDRWNQTSKDPILNQSIKIAMRDLLSRMGKEQKLFADWVDPSAPKSPLAIDSPKVESLIPVLLALRDQLPLDPLVAWVVRQDKSSDRIAQILPTIASAASLEQSDRILPMLDKVYGENPEQLGDQWIQMAEAQKKRFGKVAKRLEERLQQWYGEETNRLAILRRQLTGPLLHFHSTDREGRWTSKPWGTETRPRMGSTSQLLMSSLQLGESYTGQMQTSVFPAPASLRFWIAGHNGMPNEQDHKKNAVVLEEANGREIARFYPPRNDTAIEVSWDAGELKGKWIRLRVIDGDDQNAYAWIAIRTIASPADQCLQADASLQRLLRAFRTVSWDNPAPTAWEWNADQSLDLLGRYEWVSGLLRSESPVASALLEQAFPQGWAEGWEAGGQMVLPESGPFKDPLERQILPALRQFATAPQQSLVAQGLGSLAKGRPWLVESMEKGWLSRDVLLDFPDSWWDGLSNEPIDIALKGMRPEDRFGKQELQQLVAQRIKNIRLLNGTKERGKVLFQEKCALCHHLAGQGTVLGPQLEGVGKRGPERLCEDILLPNRNVDEAFRTRVLLTTSGQVLTGLVRQRGENSIELVDQKGVATTLPVEEIEEEKGSELSLMPANFHESLDDQQMADLLEFLKQ